MVISLKYRFEETCVQNIDSMAVSFLLAGVYVRKKAFVKLLVQAWTIGALRSASRISGSLGTDLIVASGALNWADLLVVVVQCSWGFAEFCTGVGA